MNRPALTVLVVDDSEDHRALLEHALSRSGYTVRAAASGEEALRLLEGVDVVLLDYRLPGMSGLETLAALRERHGPCALMVTGMGSEHLAVDAMRTGAIDYVVKDGDYLRTLPDRVERAWRHHDLARRSAELQRLTLLITSRLDEQDIVREVVTGARMLLNTRACALCVHDDGGMHMVAVDGVPIRDPEQLLRAARGFSLATLHVVAPPGQLLVEVPSPDDEPLGVLAFVDDVGRQFSPEERELAEAFAAFAGLALRNMRQFQRERRLNLVLRTWASQQAALAALGQRALASGDPLALPQEIVNRIADLVQVEYAAVYELAENPLLLVLRAAAGSAATLLPPRIPVAEWAEANEALAHGEPVPAAATPNALPAAARSMVVPISGRRGPYGLLALAGAGDAIESTNLDFLQSLVNVLGAAVESQQARQALVHQTLHDPLTGLPNRVLLMDRLQTALARSGRAGKRVAVLFADIDRFKVVNDSLGHSSGDRLLVEVARRLVAVLRPSDTVARFGGDEFVVLSEVHDEAAATELAERLMATLTSPVRIDGRDVAVTASIGVVVAADPKQPVETLLRDADAAMYQAKERGRARHELFTDQVRRQAIDRLDAEGALRRAMEGGEMRLHFQPQFAATDGALQGVEALVRWQRPGVGLLTPQAFLTIAEETGLIVPLGRWVLREAVLRMAAAARVRPVLEDAVLWVNLSLRELSEPTLTHWVGALLEEAGLPPARLGLEITESAVMNDMEAVRMALSSLHRLGVHTAIDDFGTGFSSLSHLRRFPIDVLKIDRSFVDGVGRDSEDTAIVQAVVGLGHSLGLQVVAEGVETADHLRLLRDMSCDVLQGYYLGRPVALGELATTPRAGWRRVRA